LREVYGTKEKPPFGFISENDFFALSAQERALYLVRAAQELELRQMEIRRLLTKVGEPERT
jgi:hypothetical protein